jgi:hypothetical protein
MPVRILAAMSIVGLTACKPAATNKSASVAARSPESQALLADNPWASTTPEQFLQAQKVSKVDNMLEFSARDVRVYMSKAEDFRSDDDDDEEESDFARCWDRERKGKAEAQGNTFHLHVEIDARRCFPSTPGRTITESLFTMDILFVCEHGGLAKFDGTDGLEASPKDCDPGKFLRYSKSQINSGVKQDKGEVVTQQITYEADPATGLPCVAAIDDSGKISGETCAKITTNFYEVEKLDGEPTKRQGKTDLKILDDRPKGSITDITLNNWQGEIAFTSDNKATYEMRSDRDEVIKGNLTEAMPDDSGEEEAGLGLTRKQPSAPASGARVGKGRVKDQIESRLLPLRHLK